MNFQPQEYLELESIEDAYAKLEDWEVFQVKYDGIWARVVIEGDYVKVYSKTDQLKTEFGLKQGSLFPSGRTELIGEFMFGSQWSQAPEYKGKIYIFDAVMVDSVDLSYLAYSQRYRYLVDLCIRLGDPFRIVETASKLHLGNFWLRNSALVEGVILRNWKSTYYTKLLKLKYAVEDDFVIMGYEEGKGRLDGSLGALVLGQYDDQAQLVEVMKVGGGFTDELRDSIWEHRSHFLGAVCLIQGKARFESGALRHPTFICIRTDKIKENCRLKRISSS